MHQLRSPHHTANKSGLAPAQMVLLEGEAGGDSQTIQDGGGTSHPHGNVGERTDGANIGNDASGNGSANQPRAGESVTPVPDAEVSNKLGNYSKSTTFIFQGCTLLYVFVKVASRVRNRKNL